MKLAALVLSFTAGVAAAQVDDLFREADALV